jgi:hypothetical protein
MEWNEISKIMTKVMRLKNLSLNTGKTYTGWCRQFQAFVMGKLQMISPHSRHIEAARILRGIQARKCGNCPKRVYLVFVRIRRKGNRQGARLNQRTSRRRMPVMAMGKRTTLKIKR